MRIEIKLLDSPQLLSEEAKIFWANHVAEANMGAIILNEDNQILGFMRACLVSEENTLYASGTFIEEEIRGQGYALKLWESILASIPPNTLIFGASVSKGGQGLLNKLKISYPEFRFDI